MLWWCGWHLLRLQSWFKSLFHMHAFRWQCLRAMCPLLPTNPTSDLSPPKQCLCVSHSGWEFAKTSWCILSPFVLNAPLEILVCLCLPLFFPLYLPRWVHYNVSFLFFSFSFALWFTVFPIEVRSRNCLYLIYDEYHLLIPFSIFVLST